MEKIQVLELDRVLKRFYIADENFLTIDLDNDKDAAIIKLLMKLGELEQFRGSIKGFGNGLRINLTESGTHTYINEGFKKKHKDEILRYAKDILDVIKFW